MIFLNSERKTRFYVLFFAFLRKEKVIYLLEMLTYTTNLFLCLYTVDIFILFANFDCDFAGKIKEIIGKFKFPKQIEKLYRNHEQELQIRIASLFSQHIIVPEIIFLMKNKGAHIVINDLAWIKGVTQKILNKKLEKCDVFFFQQGGILESFEGGANVFIGKEGKFIMEMEMRGFSGQFIFRNAGKVGKNSEVWRSFAVGKIGGMGVEMGGYVGMVIEKKGEIIRRKVWLYASNYSHDFGLVVKLF